MEQDDLRADGKLRAISVHADNLAEAAHKAIIDCYDSGLRIETPKHVNEMSLGYDAPIIVTVLNPEAEPKIYYPAFHDTPLGTMQYILEVTHGIHNHWKKNPENPERWGYTYNERFVEQLPFIFKRIKADLDKNKRITGRDYMADIWRAGEDIILEQQDPPCLQRLILRFTKNAKGEILMNYLTSWRSRDLFKAWNQNDVAQIGSENVPGMFKLLRDKVSNMLGIKIKIGSYIDYSDSLHLYGLYVDRDALEKKIERMKEEGYETRSMALDKWLLMNEDSLDITGLKRLIAAQSDAEAKGYGLNQPRKRLIELGYDVDNFPYPQDWDSWPSSWDAIPDKSKLARVF